MKDNTAVNSRKKEFDKLKRFVSKRFPGANTQAYLIEGVMYYRVVDGDGRIIVDPSLLIPPAKTVKQAWTDAKYASWFTNMIRKSNNAFSEEKMYKKIAKEIGERW